MQVSTWHNRCLDLGWACVVCCHSPPFLRLGHLVNSWICLSLCNFGQMFPLLLLLPYSTLHTYSSNSTLGAWVHEEACTLGWCSALLIPSPGCFERLPDSCFWGFSEGKWRNDLPFELSYWDMSVNYLWLRVIEKVRKLRLLIFSVKANFSVSGFPLPCTAFSSYG